MLGGYVHVKVGVLVSADTHACVSAACGGTAMTARARAALLLLPRRRHRELRSNNMVGTLPPSLGSLSRLACVRLCTSRLDA